MRRLKEECGAVLGLPVEDFTLWELIKGSKAAHLDRQLSGTIQDADLFPEQHVLVEKLVRFW